MAKFQPRISINNPEKNIPDNIIEQFFVTLKTGDIDKIRDFANKYKNKYNLIEKGTRNSNITSGKTPYHVVLELDDKIADVNTKNKIIKFLDQMGAPMDLPDSTNKWPIHLAAELQSEKIVDFFVKKKVQIDRKDGSNNTPLHYAIYGKELECPKPVSIKNLNPALTFDKINLNKTLEIVNRILMKLLSENSSLNQNVMYMINTLYNIPQMYENDKLMTELQKEVVDIFVDVAMTSSYPSDPGSRTLSKVDGMTTQQTKLEQLIDRTYTKINDELLGGLTNTMDIAPNNGGWGPTVNGNPPSDLQKIMKVEDYTGEIAQEAQSIKDKITVLPNTSDVIVRTDIPEVLKNVDDYINKLIFCHDCDAIDYGENIMLEKMLHLLVYNEYINNYESYFAKRIMDNYILVDNMFHTQILNKRTVQRRVVFRGMIDIPVFPKFASNQPNVLFNTDIDFMINGLDPNRIPLTVDPLLNVKTIMDLVTRDIFLIYKKYYIDNQPRLVPNPINIKENCIQTEFVKFFTTSDDIAITLHDEFDGLLGTTNLNNLINMPEYEKYSEDFHPFRQVHGNRAWIDMLNDVIGRIQPRPSPGRNYIANNIFEGPLIGSTNLPETPFASTDDFTRRGGRDTYTFYELFRMMQAIDDFLLTGDFQIMKYPPIFGYKINNWNDYVNDIANSFVHDSLVNNSLVIMPPPFMPINRRILSRGSIGMLFPDFIFLYRIFITRVQSVIRNVIMNCIRNIVKTEFPDIDTTGYSPALLRETSYFRNRLTNLKKFFLPINDTHLYYLLLPSEPAINEYQGLDLFTKHQSNVWDKNMDLVKRFSGFLSSIPETLLNELVQEIDPIAIRVNQRFQFLYSPNIVIFSTLSLPVTDIANYNTLRNIIEMSYSINETELINITNQSNFRNAIRQYFGVKTEGGANRILNRRVIPQFHDIIEGIDFNDVINLNMQKHNNGRITDLNLLEETTGFIFIIIKNIYNTLKSGSDIVNLIVSDITKYINIDLVYYIPQIFLPALIIQIVNNIGLLIEINNNINKGKNQITNIYSLMDTSNNYISNIITLTNRFFDFINDSIKSMGLKFNELITYHNDVINYLNIDSSRKLNSVNRRSVFNESLMPIKPFPNLFETSIPDLKNLQNVLESYKIGNIIYYGDIINDASKLKNNPVFELGPNPPTGSTYAVTYHGNDLSRTTTNPAKLSDMPRPGLGLNLQRNFEVQNNGIAIPDPVYILQETKSITGKWLNMDLVSGPLPLVTFFEGFISYQDKDVPIGYPNSIAPSIKSSASSHLKIIKSDIIQDVLQYIVDNYQSRTNADLVKMYDDVLKLANENTYTNIDHVKVYVIVAKLLDNIMNNLMEYTIRQAISSWILGFATRDNRFHNIIDNVNKTIALIQEKTFMKLSLNDVKKKELSDILLNNPFYVDFEITQIEPNPNNIKYSNNETISKEFIHYLYDINYFSTGNINTNKNCYFINPKIALKLITGSTINAKNSDGNTPLHLAVYMHNLKLVKELISKDAKPKGFRNIHGHTPKDTSIILISRHCEYTLGDTLIETINNFVFPFNDLLLSRLKEDKYGNNIVKYINMGIPIQLVMYNHMFYSYMTNYRYNFHFELKNRVLDLLKKYNFDTHQSYPYPIDLFEIDDVKLKTFMENNMPTKKAYDSFNETNEKKINDHQKKLDEINTQLQGLNKELTTVNPKQTKSINDVILDLEKQKKSTELEMDALKLDPQLQKVDDGYVDILTTIYKSSITTVTQNIDRNLNLVDFYMTFFNKIGNTSRFYLAIWDNYLNKNIRNTPTMIFSVLNNILYKLVNRSNRNSVDPETKSEIVTITDFYEVVKNYIESKNPNSNLTDNPTLRQEYDQIVYLINLILTPAMENMILNQIYYGFKEQDITNSIIKNKINFLDEIKRIKFNDQTLHSYLHDVLPLLSIKHFTNVYNNVEDYERKIAMSNDLFLPILQIIKSNKIIQITDESVFVQNIKEYLIPFMSNTYQYFIYHLRLAIYGYERYLLNTLQLCKILISLI